MDALRLPRIRSESNLEQHASKLRSLLRKESIKAETSSLKKRKFASYLKTLKKELRKMKEKRDVYSRELAAAKDKIADLQRKRQFEEDRKRHYHSTIEIFRCVNEDLRRQINELIVCHQQPVTD